MKTNIYMYMKIIYNTASWYKRRSLRSLPNSDGN